MSCTDGPTGPTLDASAFGRLSVGEQTACALTGANALYCWGLNSAFFEYGVDPGTRPASASPVHVDAPQLFSLVFGVSQHMCGQSVSGLICWGRGGFGQIGGGGGSEPAGNPFTQVVNSPLDIVTVSRLSTCGVTTAGIGVCWGSNQRGEIGTTVIPTGGRSASPVALETTEKFKFIAAGWQHACGITTSDVVMCWGDNTRGQLGIGSVDPAGTPASAHAVPARIASDEKFSFLSAGALQTCGITLDHRALCWGDNEMGQLGDGTRTDRAVPTPVAGTQRFAVIAVGSGFRGGAGAAAPTGVSTAGAAHTCALTTAGAAYCWGWNGDGQLGDGTQTDRTSPVAVLGGSGFGTIGAGGAFTCAMRGDQVSCWGANASGQLGNGSTGPASTSPHAVLTPFANP